MVTENNTGTQAATLGTEHTLATITDAGVFQLQVDAAALANGETLTLRMYSKVLSGGTERIMMPSAVYVNAQLDPIKFSLAIMSTVHLRFTLQQDGGTGRSYPWKVLKG